MVSEGKLFIVDQEYQPNHRDVVVAILAAQTKRQLSNYL